MGRPSNSADPQAGIEVTTTLTAGAANPYELSNADAGKTFTSAVSGTQQITLPSFPLAGAVFVFNVIPGFPIQINANGNILSVNGSILRASLGDLSPATATSYTVTQGRVVVVAPSTPGNYNIILDSRPQSMDADAQYGPFDRWAFLEQKETDPNPTPIYLKWQGGTNDLLNLHPSATFAAQLIVMGIHAGDTATPDKRGGVWYTGEVCFYKRSLVAGVLTLKNVWGLGAELGTASLNITSGSTPEQLDLQVVPAIGGGVEGRWFARMIGIQGYGTIWT